MIAAPVCALLIIAMAAKMNVMKQVEMAAIWGDFPNGVDINRDQLASDNLWNAINYTLLRVLIVE